ncbi:MULTISPECIES: hypothetical protein [Nocardioides]|uniref:Uncharacterized protein n=1 Tax=Nocardioides vastitatis TaxID=2568655 RepID=A0ABW0ZE74_9ACTN|nr:hypothetical protein [Nocardioides sp.]THI91592.1 hypothetical protein E7Z54_22255 [Nocardioides sp.]
MEQIEVALSAFTHRSRSLTVSHVDQALSRGLEPAEHLIVHDPVTNEHFTAVVADIHFELADTSYRLELGTRITATEAAEWLAPSVAGDDRLTTRDLIDLLAELRRSEREVSEALAEIRAR